MYSINVQAICDANHVFTDVVCRWPGSTHDSHIYKSSGIYIHLHGRNFPANSYLLGDSGYPLEHFLLTPILSPLTREECRYNDNHRKTRKVIEMSFGILKSRFRILHKTGGVIGYQIEKCVQIIMCCFILHNFARKNKIAEVPGDQYTNGDYVNDDEEAPNTENHNQLGRNIRDQLINYNFQ